MPFWRNFNRKPKPYKPGQLIDSRLNVASVGIEVLASVVSEDAVRSWAFGRTRTRGTNNYLIHYGNNGGPSPGRFVSVLRHMADPGIDWCRNSARFGRQSSVVLTQAHIDVFNRHMGTDIRV